MSAVYTFYGPRGNPIAINVPSESVREYAIYLARHLDQHLDVYPSHVPRFQGDVPLFSADPDGVIGEDWDGPGELN